MIYGFFAIQFVVLLSEPPNLKKIAFSGTLLLFQIATIALIAKKTDPMDKRFAIKLELIFVFYYSVERLLLDKANM